LQFLILTRNEIEDEESIETAKETQSQSDSNSSTPTTFSLFSLFSPTVSEDPGVSDVWKHVADEWKLGQPKMIISVTGGAKEFDMDPRLLTSFKRGLMKAVTATGQ